MMSQHVNELLDLHAKDIKDFKAQRAKIMESKGRQPPLTHTQEWNIERKKGQLMRAVERSANVGDSLLRLKICSKQAAQFLAETKEFNLRHEDPAEWQRQLKERQQKEQDSLQAERCRRRVSLIKLQTRRF